VLGVLVECVFGGWLVVGDFILGGLAEKGHVNLFKEQGAARGGAVNGGEDGGGERTQEGQLRGKKSQVGRGTEKKGEKKYWERNRGKSKKKKQNKKNCSRRGGNAVQQYRKTRRQTPQQHGPWGAAW